jgi:pimeloyl-ACP methyl ester carboxylesterase
MILRTIERGAGAPALAMTHGLFGRATNLATVQKRLAEHRRVLTLDLRNHGSSPHADGMTYPAMADDVVETLAALGAAHGTAPWDLLGHSMGGKVAMTVALRHPATIRKLIVADIAPVRYRSEFTDYIAAMRGMRLFPGMTRADADAALATTIPEPAIRGFLAQNLITGPDPRWTVGLEEIAAGLDDILDWPATDAVFAGPVLFLTGGSSRYVRPEHHAAITALFPAVRFATLPTAGHWLHADDPEGFIAAVDEFLA